MKRFRKRVMKRNKLMALVRRYFAPGPILDVGCGSGRRTLELGDRFVPCGIEISRHLAAEAHRLFSSRGGTVVHGDGPSGLKQFPDNYFSGGIMCSYLEHELHPRRALRGAFQVLKPGGRLIIKVPNFGSINRRLRQARWCGIRLPDHVNYFTPASLRRLVEEAGLCIVQFNLLDHLPTSDNMWLVALKPAPTP